MCVLDSIDLTMDILNLSFFKIFLGVVREAIETALNKNKKNVRELFIFFFIFFFEIERPFWLCRADACTHKSNDGGK